MRTLFIGLTGDDVRVWEYFLLGINPTSKIVVDGVFDQTTKDETKKFQLSVGFSGSDVDGIVGPMTLGKAYQNGFNNLIDDSGDEFSSGWPKCPDGFASISVNDRESLFGKFSYVPAPVPGNPEGIKIIDGWVGKNITTVTIPQLVNVRGASKNGKVHVHAVIADQLVALFEAWEKEMLLDRVLSWAGSWNPRFVRGSRTVLSNHAWGTAFDINAAWNPLGSMPALKGKKGCVRELVTIAYEFGWGWGGWFPNRSDGMHFECHRVIP